MSDFPTAIFLCDRTGNAAKPWAEAGYPCLCLDLQHSIRRDYVEGNITFRWADVRSVTPSDLPRHPAFIAAFPPCTHGAVSGARDWKRKGIQGGIDWLTTIEACRKLCEWFGVPYMLEQPVVDRFIASRWREPDYSFHPWQYGDNYTKKTNLWTGGGFIMPETTVTVRPCDVEQTIWKMPPGDDRADLRSATPMGFARAVFSANAPRVKEGAA